MPGSSPLARGLPPRLTWPWRNWGIIPARAGFTRTGTCATHWETDHPRSRGVYGASCDHPGCDAGSSPLARGLLLTAVGHADDDRIIPARAGFTQVLHLRLQGRQGSSPLARGLRARPARAHPHFRIIPARAGFTGYWGRQWVRSRDHPRSRGVYHECDGLLVGDPGSSPLARGLLSQQNASAINARIIPARAGFTAGHRHHSCGRRDHPRSRGVYDAPLEGSRPLRGSSPLARGLPAPPATTPDAKRIIPARAGFTWTRRPPRGPPTDHPRSRGVYCRARSAYGDLSGSSPLARGLRTAGRAG